MLLNEQGLDQIVVERLGLEGRVRPTCPTWREVVDRTLNTRHEVTVAMVGKYVESRTMPTSR